MTDLLNRLFGRTSKKSSGKFSEGITCIQNYIANNELNVNKPIIAVAGTNGKGSCVATLTEIYLRAGYQVGAYVSPHLDKITERFLLNGQPIDDHSFNKILERLLDEPTLETLSFFEILTLCAWHLWLEIDPDVIIMEVGLGGRLDAVNALPLTASIITSIDYDHMDILGESLVEIALEKSGIARPGLPLVVAEPNMPTEAIAMIDQIGATLYQVGFAYEAHIVDQAFIWSREPGSVMHLPRPKLHPQSVGAALMMVTALNDQIPVDPSCFEDALSQADLPGRFECINDRQQIWVDVAHNVPAVENLVDRWPFAWEESCCIVAFRKDKDWRNMIEVITKYTKHIYAVDLADEDMVPANDIIKAIKLDELSIIKSSALAEFLNDITEKTLIFGSFKIVNLARQISQNQLSWDSPNQLGEDDA